MYNWMSDSLNGKIFRRLAEFSRDLDTQPSPRRRWSDRSADFDDVNLDSVFKNGQNILSSRPKTTGHSDVAKSFASDEYLNLFNTHAICPTQQSIVSDEIRQHRATDDKRRQFRKGSCGASLATADNTSEPSENDSFATVFELTEDTISNWNTVIQCQRVIDKMTEYLDEVEEELDELDETMIMQEPVPKERWQDLFDQRRSILNALETAKINIVEPRAQIYAQWERFLYHANLLRRTQADEDFGEPYNDIIEEYEKYEKQMKKQDKPYLRGKLDDQILIKPDPKHVESTLRQAREVADGWDVYRAPRHADSLRLFAGGKSKDTEDDFNHTMLHEALAAIDGIFHAQETYDDDAVHGDREAADPSIPELNLSTESSSARHIAEAALLRARTAYLDAKEYVDGWDANYHHESHIYLQEVQVGACSLSQTEFDLRMLDTARRVNSRFVTAEKVYRKARKQALDVGVLHCDEDQSSGFPDYPDDGYRESFEEEMIRENDTEGIWKWLSRIDLQSSCNASDDLDADEDWYIESLGSEDDASIYDIEHRQRIDKWKEMCDEVRATLPVELRWFVSSKDEKIKAGLEGSGRERRFSCVF